MSTQYPPSAEPVVLMVSLSWAVISAVLLAQSIRMEAGMAVWIWTLSFVVSSVIAVVFFWRLV